MNAVREWIEAIPWGETIGAGTLTVVVAGVVYYIAGWVLLPVVFRAVGRSAARWDDILLDRQFLHRVAMLAPALVVCYAIPLIPGLSEAWSEHLRRVANASVILIVAASAISAMTAGCNLYSTLDASRDRPIEGYVHIAKVAVLIFGVVYAIAVVSNRSPWFLLSGLGALMAILLLVFRETILSVVASIQIAQNDMIRVGDWIDMPQHHADGHVVQVTLHTVKVQNWDKTTTTVPVHAIVQEPYRNWRGMQEAGGRRVKRAVSIDISTVRFLTDEEIERFRQFDPLRDYMERKLTELASHAVQNAPEPGIAPDARRLTNIGTFRAYVWAYLERRPDLDTESMTFLVRQLAPGPNGLPLEVYAFAKDTSFAGYEGIQADVFDHILAMVPEFGLRTFQIPSGTDVRVLVQGLGEAAGREQEVPQR